MGGQSSPWVGRAWGKAWGGQGWCPTTTAAHSPTQPGAARHRPLVGVDPHAHRLVMPAHPCASPAQPHHLPQPHSTPSAPAQTPYGHTPHPQGSPQSLPPAPRPLLGHPTHRRHPGTPRPQLKSHTPGLGKHPLSALGSSAGQRPTKPPANSGACPPVMSPPAPSIHE